MAEITTINISSALSDIVFNDTFIKQKKGMQYEILLSSSYEVSKLRKAAVQ